MTLLAAADAGLQPWTEADMESMQDGVVINATVAYGAVLELQRQVHVWLMPSAHDADWDVHASCACCLRQLVVCLMASTAS